MNWKNFLLVPAAVFATGCAKQEQPYTRIQNGVEVSIVKPGRYNPLEICYSDTATVGGVETQYCYSSGNDITPEVRHVLFPERYGEGETSVRLVPATYYNRPVEKIMARGLRYHVLLSSDQGQRLIREGAELKARFRGENK